MKSETTDDAATRIATAICQSCECPEVDCPPGCPHCAGQYACQTCIQFAINHALRDAEAEIRRLREGLAGLKFPTAAGQFDSVDCVAFNKDIDAILGNL